MQVDINRLKILIGEQAVTIVALGGQIEDLTKERDELKAKLDAMAPSPPVMRPRPQAVDEG